MGLCEQISAKHFEQNFVVPPSRSQQGMGRMGNSESKHIEQTGSSAAGTSTAVPLGLESLLLSIVVGGCMSRLLADW
jgi:hypothetical protein